MVHQQKYVHDDPMGRERPVVGDDCQWRAVRSKIVTNLSSLEIVKLFYLLAQLEDGKRESSDEWEERQLKCVPGFKSKNSQGEGDQSHGFQ